MYLDLYALFQIEKKRFVPEKKELLIKQILAVWLYVLGFFLKSWIGWEM